MITDLQKNINIICIVRCKCSKFVLTKKYKLYLRTGVQCSKFVFRMMFSIL